MQTIQRKLVGFNYKKCDIHINEKNISKDLLEFERFTSNDTLQDNVYYTIELICKDEKYKWIARSNFLIPFKRRNERERKFLSQISIILDISVSEIEDYIRKIRGYDNK